MLHYCSHLSLIISQSFDLMFQRTKSSRVNFVNRPIRTKIWQAFLRYIIYCLLIFVLLLRYFSTKYVKQTHTKNPQNTETNAKIYCMRLLLYYGNLMVRVAKYFALCVVFIGPFLTLSPFFCFHCIIPYLIPSNISWNDWRFVITPNMIIYYSCIRISQKHYCWCVKVI